MIRNFLYLDSQKLRSISSQVFEGFSESVVSSSHQGQSERETQRGPMTSGRLLADILTTERSSSELKFLEDHAYTLFETHLLDSGLVDVIDSASAVATRPNRFVKVSARLQVNDLAATHNLLKDFNQIGEAFWRVTNVSHLATPQGKKISDSEVKRKAAEIGMQLDRSFSDAAAKLLEYGFRDLLEASMTVNGNLYSAPLKREFLRETEDLILHKYSRHSQISFVLLGLVTQQGGAAVEEEAPADVKDADGVKNAIRALSLHMRTLEQVFAGPSAAETVIDPIALYAVV